MILKLLRARRELYIITVSKCFIWCLLCEYYFFIISIYAWKETFKLGEKCSSYWHFRMRQLKMHTFIIQLRKGKSLWKNSLHGTIAASVLLKLFISGNKWFHTTPSVSGTLFSKANTIQSMISGDQNNITTQWWYKNCSFKIQYVWCQNIRKTIFYAVFVFFIYGIKYLNIYIKILK